MLNRAKPHPLRSLRAKQVLLLILIGLQALFSGGYLYQAHQRIELETANVLAEAATLQSRNFELTRILIGTHLKAIGDGRLLGNDAPRISVAQEVQKEWLDAIILLDEKGNIITQASLFELETLVDPKILDKKSFADSPFYQQWRNTLPDEVDMFTLSVNDQLGGGSLAFYRAIRNKQGVFVGSVLGFISHRSLRTALQQSQLNAFELSDTGSVIIFDKSDNKLLFHSQRSKTAAKFAHVVAKDRPLGHGLQHFATPDGQQHLGAFKPLRHPRWVLVTQLGQDEYLHGWRIQVGISLLVFLYIAFLQWQLVHLIQRKQEQHARLKYIDTHDRLTDLANRPHFEQWLAQASKQAMRYRRPLSLLAINLDHFKHINAEHGHDAGDALLNSIAALVQHSLREGELAARFSGDEFIVGLPRTSLTDALIIAEQLRAAIAAHTFTVDTASLRCTVSIGAVLLQNAPLDEALQQLKQTLAHAKQMGRNCVIAGDRTGMIDHATLNGHPHEN